MEDEVHDANDEAGESPVPAEETVEVARETRGIRWIIGPALLGMVTGALIDVVFLKHSMLPEWWGEERTAARVLADGGSVGLIVGGAIGTLIWAFFPYQRTKPATGTTEHADED
jgi:hypothetical protein